jgi:hypothetical protein
VSTEELQAFLQERLEINKDNLDRELVWQAELFHKAAHAYALAVSRRDELKEEIRLLSADLALLLRRKLEAKGKVTEGLVQNHLEAAPDYQALRKQLAEASRETEILAALKEAYSQRSWMLRELCSMYIAGYFSTTSIRGEASKQVEEEANLERRRRIMAQERSTRK